MGKSRLVSLTATIALGLGCLPACADAAAGFSDQPPIAGPADFFPGTNDVVTADLDGDGFLDVVTTGREAGGGALVWYRNDGSGHFGPRQIIAVDDKSTPVSIFTIDLDGDGDTDVLHGVSQGKIVWFENNGSGDFAAEKVISTAPSQVRSVFAIDLDGDGHADVLSANGQDDAITWYENDGTGNFGAQKKISTETETAVAVFGIDLDGDGDVDVISASTSDDKVAWYENDGDGNFGPQQVISALNIGNAAGLFAADLDGDGDADVVAGSSDGVAWYENDGTGAFGGPNLITDDGLLAEIHAADLDGDSDTDVLVAAGLTVTLYENDGAGGFTERNGFSEPDGDANSSRPDSIVVADMNGDGENDIVTGPIDDEIRLYVNNQGVFSERKVSRAAISARAVVTADIDGDGRVDVFSVSSFETPTPQSANDRVAWHRNLGQGAFGPPRIIFRQNGDQNFVQSIFAEDLDGDGDVDLLDATTLGDRVHWYENDGNGSFGPRQLITNDAITARSVFAIDLDGDGDVDVLSASEGDDKVAWYENDGIGNFGPQQVISTDAERPLSVFAVDLDGDGDIDVLSASTGDDKIAWYENDGSGSFGAQQVITDGASQAERVFASDLDGDGDQDVLALSNLTGQQVTWYENDGDGGFGPARPVGSLSSGNDIHATDLDGDGIADLLAVRSDPSNPEVNEVVWFQNDGSGQFGPRLSIKHLRSAGYQSVWADDLDGDGDADVVSAASVRHRVDWFRNDVKFDHGDAPDPDYPTLLTSNGARHLNTGPLLGSLRDIDPDGQASATADGDDADSSDDDDGVQFNEDATSGRSTTITVTASAAAKLDAWIDFNTDGDWQDAGEQIFNSESLNAGSNVFSVDVPADATPGETFARFRLSTAGALATTGEASDGEVEDYVLTIIDGVTDTDEDGMPDSFENANGLNPNDPSDAAEDADRDGLSNAGEFEAGTDPNDFDTDGDGIGDGFDNEPTAASNACTGANAELANELVQSGTVLQCGASGSISMTSSVMIEVGGRVELFAPIVALQPGVSVAEGAELFVQDGLPRAP